MAIVNGYITLSELKSALGGTILGTADDAAMELAIESASRLIDEYTGQRFWVDGSVVQLLYTAYDKYAIDVDGISTTTGLIIKTDDDDDGVYETTWTAGTDYRLEPTNAVAKGLPYTRIVATGSKLLPLTSVSVQVTAKGGWPAVPAPVRNACQILAMRLYKRKDAPFGISGSPEQQGEMRLVSPIDWDVKALLNQYRRFWVVK